MALHTNVWGNRSNRGNRVTVGRRLSVRCGAQSRDAPKFGSRGCKMGFLPLPAVTRVTSVTAQGRLRSFSYFFSGMFVRSDIFPYLAPRKFDSM